MTSNTASVLKGLLTKDTLSITAHQVREALIAGEEIALLDVREEAPHAEGHPLFAANLPYSRLEVEAFDRLPRKTVPIVVLDNGEGLAEDAAARLFKLGFTDIKLLVDGLQGWIDAGYELFRDVNAPSKAFGELVEATRHTPSLSANEVKYLIDARANIVVLDARKFDEYHTMNIPTSISVPGGELALRVRQLAPDPNTRIVVNCAGRTRSIIGTQSLINVGIPNPVSALRNGTIGWTLANQQLEHGQSRRPPQLLETSRADAAISARKVADASGVLRTSLQEVDKWTKAKTIYRFDVRSPEEFEVGGISGFRNAPGGQLVQETDVFAPVRNAHIVLVDDDSVRANITGSWLAQMGWHVFVIDGLSPSQFAQRTMPSDTLLQLPSLPEQSLISPSVLSDWLSGSDGAITILDLARSSEYAKRHILGAWFALRSTIKDALSAIPATEKIVITSLDGIAALFSWEDVVKNTTIPVFVLRGGTDQWIASGFPVTDSHPHYACKPNDRYRRPYEGTNVEPEAMQAYLDWEYGLVQQLERDGTHGFWVLH